MSESAVLLPDFLHFAIAVTIATVPHLPDLFSLHPGRPSYPSSGINLRWLATVVTLPSMGEVRHRSPSHSFLRDSFTRTASSTVCTSPTTANHRMPSRSLTAIGLFEDEDKEGDGGR
ncbi:hypothetical protein L2E82_19427 [Cichorium intybus]|uniref:Uncharacterized protein n=1 Tax=Cichorium intybus TaxID=13427 RepID=A0ACB9FBD6_CICIN|nr:hypothetical protein L2E82_19427 [Cichorium intybus]